VILLNQVVQGFGLAQINIKAGIFIDAANGGGIGTTLVYGCSFGQAMQIDGTLQVAPRCRQVSLGGEVKVHCVSAFVDAGGLRGTGISTDRQR
jgi:hypothetical protein